MGGISTEHGTVGIITKSELPLRLFGGATEHLEFEIRRQRDGLKEVSVEHREELSLSQVH